MAEHAPRYRYAACWASAIDHGREAPTAAQVLEYGHPMPGAVDAMAAAQAFVDERGEAAWRHAGGRVAVLRFTEPGAPTSVTVWHPGPSGASVPPAPTRAPAPLLGPAGPVLPAWPALPPQAAPTPPAGFITCTLPVGGPCDPFILVGVLAHLGQVADLTGPAYAQLMTECALGLDDAGLGRAALLAQADAEEALAEQGVALAAAATDEAVRAHLCLSADGLRMRVPVLRLLAGYVI